jgi:hypothetical protein
MCCRILIVLLMASSVFGSGLDSHAPAQELLSRHPICLTGAGRVAIAFQDAADILGREDLLTAIQLGYAALLPEGEMPEFTVTKTGHGTYRYVNRKGQETSIEEVMIQTVPGKNVEVALYSEGIRFFGPYQSLCRIQVVPAGEGQVSYQVTVYARPDSAAVRLFARVTPVELYFRHKLNEMTGLVIAVCNQIKKTEIREENHVVSSF